MDLTLAHNLNQQLSAAGKKLDPWQFASLTFGCRQAKELLNTALQQRPESKKLLLLVSDGEPADIDERDPQYLRQDTKKAVEELATRGVSTYCLTLDAHADEYVSRIFGVRGFTVVDHVQRLPEKLPSVFMGLTR